MLFWPETKIAPRGFEPLEGNQQATDNKRLMTKSDSVLDTCLDNILQKYPEIKRIISAWPELSEQDKNTILDIVKRQ